VGWGWVTTIAQNHSVWVLTEEGHRTDIEGKLSAHPAHYRDMRFHYVPRTRWLALERLWPPSYFWTYDLWQRKAFEVASALHEQVKFDLVHAVTFVTFRSPGYLWKLGVPFVWGPVGGLENTPWRLLPIMGLKGCLHFAARNVLNSVHRRLLPGPKHAFRKAAGVVAATSAIQRHIRQLFGRGSQVICEIGSPPVMANDFTLREPGERLRLCWSGQHGPAKALPLLLRALKALGPDVGWTLDILGQGQCTCKWRRLSRRLGLDDRCRWHGWVPRGRALETMHDAHVFVITSLKDLTSTVLLEALSQGVPVVCPDHCGFSEVVNAECGIKIPLATRRQFEGDLVAAIRRLANDEPERQRLAAGALRRVRDFSWEGKAGRLNAIYEHAVNGP